MASRRGRRFKRLHEVVAVTTFKRGDHRHVAGVVTRERDGESKLTLSHHNVEQHMGMGERFYTFADGTRRDVRIEECASPECDARVLYAGDERGGNVLFLVDMTAPEPEPPEWWDDAWGDWPPE